MQATEKEGESEFYQQTDDADGWDGLGRCSCSGLGLDRFKRHKRQSNSWLGIYDPKFISTRLPLYRGISVKRVSVSFSVNSDSRKVKLVA